VHVHLRSPGGEHKEDFRTGSAAALAGGFTTLLAMPNTQPPLVSFDTWRVAQTLATSQSLCDVCLYAGASADHLDQLPLLAANAPALKIYLDQTYGPLRVRELDALAGVMDAWKADKPICLHAEGESVAIGLALGGGVRAATSNFAIFPAELKSNDRTRQERGHAVTFEFTRITFVLNG
jgi:carbamoyl-phosphate synthase/aspartate carbamoyltransferase/dihydroorotase